MNFFPFLMLALLLSVRKQLRFESKGKHKNSPPLFLYDVDVVGQINLALLPFVVIVFIL